MEGRVVVDHRRRGFDALLHSPGTVTEDQVPDCNPGHAGENPVGASIAVMAQWQSVSLPTRMPRGRDHLLLFGVKVLTDTRVASTHE